MKKIFTLSFLFTALLFTVKASITGAPGLDEVISAIRSGDGAGLARNADDNVSLALPGRSGTYSRPETATHLQAFFSANPVKSFDVKFKGEKSGNQFCIGQLQTSKGAYRATVFMKEAAGRQVVREVRFQKE